MDSETKELVIDELINLSTRLGREITLLSEISSSFTQGVVEKTALKNKIDDSIAVLKAEAEAEAT
jgi:hypothetical protein